MCHSVCQPATGDSTMSKITYGPKPPLNLESSNGDRQSNDYTDKCELLLW